MSLLLSQEFSAVYTARSVDELQTQIRKHRAQAAIVDMELVSVDDLEALSHEFPAVRFVCNHRLADDALWTAVMNAGAADCVPSFDIEGMVSAASLDCEAVHAAAA